MEPHPFSFHPAPSAPKLTLVAMSRYEGVCDVGEAGEEGENIESCAPLTYHSTADLTEDYIKSFLGRIVSSSYREPHVLSLYVMRKACILRLLADTKQLLAREATLMDCIVPHSGRVRVFGDLHGDIHSLMEALALAQLPSEHNYLCFAGDCVDRGCWGVEVLLVLFVLKLWRPFSVFLLRGNHEATSIMCRYGKHLEILACFELLHLKFSKTLRKKTAEYLTSCFSLLLFCNPRNAHCERLQG